MGYNRGRFVYAMYKKAPKFASFRGRVEQSGRFRFRQKDNEVLWFFLNARGASGNGPGVSLLW